MSSNMKDKVEHPRVQASLHLIDAWLESEQSYAQLPGLSAGLVVDQELIWSGGYGHANPAEEIPATVDTLYSICSISKLFTSIAIMQLRDAERLQLADPVQKFLPWFNVARPNEENTPITIESLLTHSSGLPRESDFPYWSPPDYRFPDHDEVKERLSGQSMLYPADTYWQYSNLGLTLAGEIVATVSGRAYADYVTEKILEPLGLDNTRPYFPNDLHGTMLAIGHSARDRNGVRDVVPCFDTKAIAPAAGFTSSVRDLAAFAAWQFRLLAGGSTEVLSASTLREMHRVHWIDPDWRTSWGLGFATERRGTSTLVGHAGACPGYLTDLVLDPKNKLAAIVMINACGRSPDAYSRRALTMLKEALDQANDPVQVAPDFSDYVGFYDAKPWSGELFVFPWLDQLAATGFPTANPMQEFFKLSPDEADAFHRVRNNDEGPGETYHFNRNAGGEVESLTRHSSVLRKITPTNT
mgnify:FL=1